jgi:hypothetical protein
VRTRALLLAGITLAAGFVVAPTSTALAETLTVSDAPASVAYLVKTYRVNEREALRRLELQRASTGLAQRLAARFPDQFGGSWLDQAGGGHLVVAMTRPELLRPALRGVADAAHIRAVRVTHSLRALQAAADRVSARAGVRAAVDQAGNRVVVPTARRDARLDSALLAENVGVAVRAAPTGVQKACDPRFCTSPPLRGGIRLDVTRDDGTFGGCTTGFNVASASGQVFVLTAGHCVESSRHQNVDLTFHQHLGPNAPVTIENEQLSINAFPNDYAIMPFQAGAFDRWFPTAPLFWTPRNLVTNWCPGGCAGSYDLAVVGLIPREDVQAGWVVCATGSGYTPAAGETYVDSGAGLGYVPGTRCGEVNGTTSGGIDVRICARNGDSGGPLFSEVERKGLGILSFGDDGSGPCTNPNEQNTYVALSTIFAHVNAVSGLGFRLITSRPRPQLPVVG